MGEIKTIAVISDIHIPHHDREAWGAFRAWQEQRAGMRKQELGVNRLVYVDEVGAQREHARRHLFGCPCQMVGALGDGRHRVTHGLNGKCIARAAAPHSRTLKELVVNKGCMCAHVYRRIRTEYRSFRRADRGDASQSIVPFRQVARVVLRRHGRVSASFVDVPGKHFVAELSVLLLAELVAVG